MSKIKIMHFVSGLISGGVEEMLYNYCKYLDHEKYEFIVVYQHKPVETCIAKIESIGCRTKRITARNENFFGKIRDSIAIIKDEKPDIVHTHMNLMNFCALYAAKKCGVQVRISHSHIAEKNKGPFFCMMAYICKKLCIKYATDLLACGIEAGKYLYGKAMKKGKVTILENAIDLQYFQKDEILEKQFREKYEVLNKFIIGHVGRFSYQKNHEKLLGIFHEILKIKENAVLLLVGTGELEEQIKKKAEELNISDKVIFYGTTSNMKEIYSVIDVFVLPSRFEGFPVVSIEIQAADIPAVFSNTIAQSCKITEAIKFCDLKLSDEQWAQVVIEHYQKFKTSDLTELYKLYDIKSKVKKLDEIYEKEYLLNI